MKAELSMSFCLLKAGNSHSDFCRRTWFGNYSFGHNEGGHQNDLRKKKIFCLQVGKSHRVARVRFRLSHDDNHGGPSEEVILPSLFSRSRKMQLAIYSKKKLAAFTVEN